MAIFKKNRPLENQAPESMDARPRTLEAGRLAPVFLQMYLWVLSVNLDFNVYQVESGTPRFSGGSFAVRGAFDQLVRTLADGMLPDYREEFLGTFTPQILAGALRGGRSNLSCVICSENGGDPECFELRAERIPTANALSLLLYARRLESEGDRGGVYKKPQPVPYDETGEIDWNSVRSRKTVAGTDVMRYEYDVQNDRLILHSGTGKEEQRSVFERYLVSLDSRSDYMVSHDSVKAMRRLITDGIDGRSGQREVAVRADFKRSAPFRHYEMSCIPLEDSGAPTWLFGSLTDIEDRYKKRKGMQEASLQIGSVVNLVFHSIYAIDTDKDTICEFIRTEDGFRAGEKVMRFSDYVNRRIESGSISEESIGFYRSLLQKGNLERKAGKGVWEADVRQKLPGDLDYRWYAESIFLAPGKGGRRFLLARRDVTEIHEARKREYEMGESLRLAKQNQAMLDSMAGLVEFRNSGSGAHIYHVRTLARYLMEDIMRRSPQYELTRQKIDLYSQAAAMHDVGKITLPDAILNKPDRLTAEEYEQMKTHTTQGARIIEGLSMPGQEELKACCYDVALHHHERWDGSGYPDGAAGDEVSVYVQAIGLADVYDALVMERCYKKALPFDKVLDMILNGQCGAFNPRLLESLKHCAKELRLLYTDTYPLTDEEKEENHGE